VRSSVKPSHAANDNLIDRTLAIWKPRFGRDLSREDARESRRVRIARPPRGMDFNDLLKAGVARVEEGTR
jgi:hypothetical protein